MKQLTKLILNDMRPALGVTEPAAIAFAVATAKTHATGILQEAHVVLNSGMYKNAFTCGIPNSNEVGNAHAAALGYVAADANKGLECLDCVTKKHNIQAKKLLAEGKITVSNRQWHSHRNYQRCSYQHHGDNGKRAYCLLKRTSGEGRDGR